MKGKTPKPLREKLGYDAQYKGVGNAGVGRRRYLTEVIAC